nr:hypothetical protein CFP56_50872 [Quercus suber]
MAGGSTFTWRHALQLHSDLSPFQSPVPQTHPAFHNVEPVSWQRRNIAGILLTFYGLDELPPRPDHVTCLWLLHGRGDTQDSMGYTAAGLLRAWHLRRRPDQRNLICICFDQRNHGSRMVDNVANVSWKQGNPTHGPDMFSTYSGTAHDLSLLLTQVPAYLPFTIDEHLCGGVSLGAHATWQILLREPRIRAGLIVVGCPDYVRLMTDRAVRSKLSSCTNTEPAGKDFVGSEDFPPALVEAVQTSDPAGLLLTGLRDPSHAPSEAEQQRLRPVLRERLAGKKILCLSGGKDKLVPYAQGKPFLDWLKAALDERSGWCNDAGIVLEDILEPDARHEFTRVMRDHAERWLCDHLAGGPSSSSEHAASARRPTSKI